MRNYKYRVCAFIDGELDDFKYALTEDEAYDIALNWWYKGFDVEIQDEEGNYLPVDFEKSSSRPYRRVNRHSDFGESLDESMAASLLNVKNQLMKVLSGDFKFTGGSMIDKFTMTSTEEPELSFDVSMDRNDLSVLPKINGMPDTMHKKRGIAIMRAVNVIRDFVTSMVDSYKPAYAESVRRLKIKESPTRKTNRRNRNR